LNQRYQRGASPVKGKVFDLKERIRRITESEVVLGTLPGLNCGLCGAPDCKNLAKDTPQAMLKKMNIFFSPRIDWKNSEGFIS